MQCSLQQALNILFDKVEIAFVDFYELLSSLYNRYKDLIELCKSWTEV